MTADDWHPADWWERRIGEWLAEVCVVGIVVWLVVRLFN